MKGFKVTSKSLKGEEALQKNLNEYTKLSRDKKIFISAIMDRFVYHDPLRLVIELKNNFLAQALRPEDFLDRLRESMDSEGVEEKIDYEVEFFDGK